MLPVAGAVSKLDYTNQCDTTDGIVYDTGISDAARSVTDGDRTYLTNVPENGNDESKMFGIQFSTTAVKLFFGCELDVKFGAADAGFTLNKKGSKLSGGDPGVAVRLHDNKLAVETGSNMYDDYDFTIDTDKWYHVTLRGSYADPKVTCMTMYIAEPGSSGDETKFENVKQRSGKAVTAQYIMVQPNTSIDNIHVYEIDPSKVTLSVDSEPSDSIKLDAGAELQLTATVLSDRNEEMPNAVTYTVSNTDAASIDSTGKLTAKTVTTDTEITVKASCGEIESETITVTINESTEPPTPPVTPEDEPGDQFDKAEVAKGGLYRYWDCSEAAIGADLMEDAKSPNKTRYLKANGSDSSKVLDFHYGTALSTFAVWQADVRFDADNSGFVLRDGAANGTKGKTDTRVCLKNGKLSLQTGGSAYPAQKDTEGNEMELTQGTWYQITLRGFYNSTEGSGAHVDMYAQAYDSDGNLIGNPRKFEDINKRNNEPPTRIVIDANTAVDNVRVYEVAEGKVTISSENDVTSMSASSSLQINSTVYTAKDELMPGHVSYSLYQNNDQLFSDDIKISEEGVLTVSGAAQEQDVTVRAALKSSPKTFDEKTIHITAIDPAQIKQIGFNKAWTKLVNFKTIIDFEAENGVVFVIAVYDENGVLKASTSRQMLAADVTPGEITVNVNMPMPSDFDKTKDQVRIFTWSR